jgi:hypothetical protein
LAKQDIAGGTRSILIKEKAACQVFHIDTLVFHGRIAPDRKKILLRWLLLMKW